MSQREKQKVCEIASHIFWNIWECCKTSWLLYTQHSSIHGNGKMCTFPSTHHDLPHWKFFWIVVINFQVWSYPVKKQIEIHHTRVQKYVFVPTETYHVLHCMEDVRMNNVQHVKCVPQCLALILQKNNTHGSILCY